jgi:hypothetical protein
MTEKELEEIEQRTWAMENHGGDPCKYCDAIGAHDGDCYALVEFKQCAFEDILALLKEVRQLRAERAGR